MSQEKKDEFDSKEGWTVFLFMITLGIVAIICCCFFCAVWCAKDSLQKAVDVIDASADFIAQNKRVILVPNIHYLLMIIFSVVLLGAFLCVVSLNEIKADDLIPQNRKLVWSKNVFYAALFMFAGYLWITAWIEYTSRYIVIMGACTYYFNNNRDKPDEQESADISYGFYTAYLNHMGSIAYASFMIALIRFIKYVFYYLAKKI